MADVTLNFTGKTPVELLGEGIKCYDAKDFQTAVAYLSQASELAAKEEGEQSESLGDIYLYYGKALLEVSRLEGDPLGDAVPRVEEEDEEDEGEESNEADTPENGKEQDKPEDAKTNGVGDEKTESKENGKEEKTDEEESKPGPSGEGEEKIEDGDKAEENEVASDLQLAWEVLELARMFFEKGGAKYQSDLADCYITLGEVSMESENLELAIRDIKQGLEIQQSYLENDCRTLAQTHYTLGLAYGINGQHDLAVEAYSKSKEILETRIAKINDEGEIKELKEVIPDIDEKISDLKNLKDELAKKLTEASTSQFQSSPEKKATDISHLVKRKRKLEDGEAVGSPTKKSA